MKHRFKKRRPVSRNRSKGRNVLRRDPTRTATARRFFAALLKRQFARLKAKIVSLVVKEDAFALKETVIMSTMLAQARWTYPTLNTRFQFNTSAEKVQEFQKWLGEQFAADLTGATEEQLWAKYIDQGFRKGAGRAFDDVNRARKATATSKEKLDFYAGSREEFLRSSFANPVSVDKVKLLAGRAFDELEGVTDTMSLKMSRILSDALVEGMSPEETARELADEVDIGFARASTIARTELVRSHAEGQLTAMEKMGIAEVGVEVEWIVTDDEKLCPECASMQGATFTIEEAHGLIPAHVNCRCAFSPSGKALYSSGKEDEGDDSGLQFSIT